MNPDLLKKSLFGALSLRKWVIATDLLTQANLLAIIEAYRPTAVAVKRHQRRVSSCHILAPTLLVWGDDPKPSGMQVIRDVIH